MSQLDNTFAEEPPVWAIFGDLMSGLVGIFVLIFVWVLTFQLDLMQSLDNEIEKREAEEKRRMALELQVEATLAEQKRLQALEDALAAPLATGRVTLENGRIGIRGSVLFSLNSDALRTEGRELLKTLIPPLQLYLDQRDELLMVSGFTDALPIQAGNLHYEDNWELSAKRALTVTRTLIEEGMPSSLVFAAAFGPNHPVASNDNDEGRAQNRRVELAPVPKSAKQ